jgi:hypothetical protein
MSDESRQAAIKAAKTGDKNAQAKAAAEQLRQGEGLLSYVMRLIGQWVYVEGARMNYIQYVVDVTADPIGQPSAIVSSECYRIGAWTEQGLSAQHVERMIASVEIPRILPWQAVDDIGIAPPEWVRQARAV